MTHTNSPDRTRVKFVIVGLLVAQFAAMLANTIIFNAMPVIVAEIGGSAQQYTWVITSAMLANTVMTPVAGKLADLYDQKRIFLASLGLFALGGALCGAAASPELLIAFRVLMGAAMGLIVTLSLTILANVVSPRERGKFNGYMGAVAAVAAVSGPLIGGLIVQWWGWRWTFWAMVPLIAVAIWLVGRFLPELPGQRPDARVDVVGAVLITLAIGTLMIWVSFGGVQFERMSWISAVLVLVALISAIAFWWWEHRADEPLIPPSVMRRRSTAAACLAAIGIGTAMMGLNAFLGQYLQYGRGHSPATSGMLTLPMVLGTLVAATLTGIWISRRGTWKEYVLSGALLVVAGATLGAILVDRSTSMWIFGAVIALIGLGVGASQQNLILAVQNSTPLRDTGAATATVGLFRMMGGAVGIQVFGVFYNRAVAGELRGTPAETMVSSGTSTSLDIGSLPDALQPLVRGAFADAIGPVFWVLVGFAVVSVVAVGLMPGTRLRSSLDIDEE